MALRNTSRYRVEDVDVNALDADTLFAIAEHYGFPKVVITYPNGIMQLNIAGTREAWKYAVWFLERDGLLDLAYLVLVDLFGEPSSEPINKSTPEWLRKHPVKIDIADLPYVPMEPTAPIVEPPLPTGEYQVELIAVERVGAYGQYLSWLFRVVGVKHMLIYHTDISNSISGGCLYLASVLLGRKIQHGEKINPQTLVGKTAIAVVRSCKLGKCEFNILEKLKPDSFRWTGDQHLTD